MSKAKIIIPIALVAIGIAGWVVKLHQGGIIDATGGRRLEALNAKPALYESEVLQANPKDPNTEGLLIVFDDVVSTLMTRERTTDYIPESAFAYSPDSARHAEKPTTPTIAIGDNVQVLEIKKSRRNETFCLVRTAQGTYGWIAPWHLNDKDGKRMATLR